MRFMPQITDQTTHKFERFIINLEVKGSAKRLRPGLVNFDTAVAYHFWLALPAAFTQPVARLLAEPCTLQWLLQAPIRVPRISSVFFSHP